MQDLIESLNRAHQLDEAITSVRVPAAIREYVDAYCNAINNMKGYNEDKWDRGTGGEFHAYGKPSSAYADRVMYGVIDNYDLSDEEYKAVYMYVEFQEELEWYDDPNVKNEFNASCVQDDDEDDLDDYDDYDDWDDDDDDFDEALNKAHELDEAAFSGGMAGDNSASGGTIRGRGASTQPGKNNYLNRMKSKNPDLVDTMVIKVSDIKPGMITQAGQVKEAEARNHPSGGKKMYIMHTNGYDGFWGLDETMDVMVDPENKSKPFAGDYRALLKMGLQESKSIKEKIGDNYSNNIEYCPSCGEYLDGSDISDERDNSVRYTCYHCGNSFDRTKYYNESKSIDEALVTDYMDSETLHRAMQHLMFGTFNAYNQEENMIVKTTTNHGAFGGVNQSHRYFKFVRGEDGWEAYEVSSTGDKVGDAFLIDNI